MAATLRYTVGAFQLQQLLTDRQRLPGDDLDLGRFHDSIMQPDHIPAALLSWEPTGLDDGIETLRASQPLDESNK